MVQTIENVIALWRAKALTEPLEGDREDIVTAWVAGLSKLVAANGLTENDLNAFLDDNPRTWAENEYDDRVKRP